MPRKARSCVKSDYYHIMVQGINKESIFEQNDFKLKYYIFIKTYLKEFDIHLIAYCIMPNHAHLLIYSKEIKMVSQFMHKLNGVYGKYYNKEKERVGYVFRDRFKMENILDEEYLYTCIDYIHMNPVKANLVAKAEEYFFSSYNEFFGKKKIINLLSIDFQKQKYECYKNRSKNNEAKFLDISLDIDKEQIFNKTIEDFFYEMNIQCVGDICRNVELRQKLVFQLVIVNDLSYNYVSKKLNVDRKTLKRWCRQEEKF